jgi:hypothetical protein
VISDLDPETRKAEDCQGESGRCTQRNRSRKYFVLKILIPKSLGLKILRAAFVKPTPGAWFSDGRGRGVPSNARDSRNGTGPNCPLNPFFYGFFSLDLHSPEIQCRETKKRKPPLRAASDPTLS